MTIITNANPLRQRPRAPLAQRSRKRPPLQQHLLLPLPLVHRYAQSKIRFTIYISRILVEYRY
ncbi:hypothetical protein RSAG8_05341, partial [Rhizoctonia solani AG-8 WAC10335]